MAQRKTSRRKKVNKYAEHSKAPKYRPVHRCSTKSRFETFTSAENVRRKIETKYSERKLKSYFCPSCQKYHHAAIKGYT